MPYSTCCVGRKYKITQDDNTFVMEFDCPTFVIVFKNGMCPLAGKDYWKNEMLIHNECKRIHQPVKPKRITKNIFLKNYLL